MSANLHCTNTPKNVVVYFKDVNTEETLSSQYQKLVETTNLWRHFLSDKDHHGANSLVQQPLAKIHLCNDHYPSRTEQMNKNEHIEMIISARHCDQKWKNL